MKIGPILSLECQVKYAKFTLTESDLNTLLDLPTVTPCPLSPTKASKHYLTEFANPHSQTNPTHLSYLVLKKDLHLLYYVLVHTILPRSNSADSVNTKTLELIYLLMAGKPVNFGHFFLETIVKVGFIRRPTPLPYPKTS